MVGLADSACAGASVPEAAEPEGEAWAGAVAAGREPPAHAPTKHETQTSKEEIRMIKFRFEGEPLAQQLATIV